MIGSLFNELQSIEPDDSENSERAEGLSYDADGDDTLVASLGVAQKIVRRQGLAFWQSEASDILQAVALRLLKWRDKYREKSGQMSPEEWKSFAARAAYNEINRHYKHNPPGADVPLDSMAEPVAADCLQGQSDAELRSLALEVWQKICCLSLRQRQALLLGSRELVLYFLQVGITDDELAENLDLTIEEWVRVKENLPLRNIQIAQILKQMGGNQNSIEAIAKSIKKARHEARAKVRRAVEK
jgi:DNA-directed RNA polymerase specialized sigma24 family protein